MRATGIVRRIDDLGRVVIPREIRRSLGIREGDALEIYTEKNQVIFQRYMPQYSADIQNVVEYLQDEMANSTDTDERIRLDELLKKTRALMDELKKAGS